MYRIKHIKTVFVIIVLIVIGCDACKRSTTENQAFPPKTMRISESGSNVLALIKALPSKASPEALIAALPALLSSVSAARSSDMTSVESGLAILRKQPNVVQAFEIFYAQIPENNRNRRRFLLAVLGELRRPDGLPLLQKVVWGALPPSTKASESFSPREIEESVQAKAVQGMAYLKSNEGEEAIFRVIDLHQSQFVRAAAIDAFLWNHGDTAKAQKEIYSRVKSIDRKLVGLARFSSKMNADTFNRQLKQWRDQHE